MSVRDVKLKMVLLAGAAALGAGPALAQSASAPAADPPAGVETLSEVVVTALKRRTNLQDTPVSITALGADAIQQSGATSVTDLLRQTPNVNFTPGPLGQARISIRGIQAAGEATTGLYYDETPVTGPAGTTQDPGNNAADLNLFDVDHVEVLRGPQGTLFGSGSMGGTLRVLYKKPDPTAYAGAIEAQYSGTESGGDGYFLKGMVNAPLIQDKLALRVSGYDEQRAGYIDNTALHLKDTNSMTLKGVRAAIAYTPTEKLSITGTVIYQKSEAPDQQGWYKSDGDYKTNSPVKLPFDSELRLYNLTGKWDSPIGQLVGTTSHYDYSILRTTDFTPQDKAIASLSSLCPLYIGISTACNSAQLAAYSTYAASRLPAVGYQPASLSTWTNELRLTGSRGPVQWTGGVYYEDRQDHIDSYTVKADAATGEADPSDVTAYRYLSTNTKQTAVFGEVSYTPIAPLTLTVGTRHYDYDKSTAGAVGVANVVAGLLPAAYSKVSSNASGWVSKVDVSYKFTPTIMGYVTYSEGFRPGGANNIPGLSTTLVAYQPDSVQNFEGGLKTSWFDRRLTIDAGGFLVKWDHLQTQAVTANQLFIFMTNAGRAEIPGAEVEITARPIPGLTLNAGAGYADAHLTQDATSVAVAATGSTGLAGDPFPNVPKLTGSASATYVWPISQAFDGLLRADYAYTGNRQSGFRSTYVYTEKEGAFATLNLRGGIEGRSWGAYIFVTNVTGVEGVGAAYSSIGVDRQMFTVPPRTIGVNVRKSF